ncbi:MAG: metallophosphoesterase [PVC group bacterium]
MMAISSTEFYGRSLRFSRLFFGLSLAMLFLIGLLGYPSALFPSTGFTFNRYYVDAVYGGSAPLPSPSPPLSVRIAVIGDFGWAGAPEEDVAVLVQGWGPDLIITAGDNNYPSGAASTIDDNIGQYYHEFMYPYTGAYGPGAESNRFFPSLGNHDWDSLTCAGGCSGPYFNYFTLPGNERYYDFEYGPVHLFFLDSDIREPDGTDDTSVQAAWLQSGLAASAAPWKIVSFHEPPYSSDEVHGSTVRMQWPFGPWGASAVISGHAHTYERLLVGDLPYFVNGLGGRSIYSFDTPLPESRVRYNGDYGAMLIEADGGYITFTFVSRGGGIVDTYMLPLPSPTPMVTGTPSPSPSATAAPFPTASPPPSRTPAPISSPTATPRTPGPTPTCGPTVPRPGFILEAGDYDGDGTADIAVFRGNTGLWAVRDITRSYFGGSGDAPVSGDYDGDGTADIGIFRSASGLWAVRGVTRSYYGVAGDTPAPADYDGDGTADVTIFRPPAGLWSARGVTRAYFGASGDSAVPGDYEGAGRAAFGIFRPSSGLWAIRGVTRIYFGGADDWPLPGDYDADGTWEAAVFRPWSTGLWAVRGVTRFYFGRCTDYPLRADFNGDGADDPGVFRQDFGLWAVRDGSRVYYGTAGDLPVTR